MSAAAASKERAAREWTGMGARTGIARLRPLDWGRALFRGQHGTCGVGEASEASAGKVNSPREASPAGLGGMATVPYSRALNGQVFGRWDAKIDLSSKQQPFFEQ